MSVGESIPPMNQGARYSTDQMMAALLKHAGERIDLNITIIDLFSLISLAQLGMRHPNAVGPSVVTAKSAIDRVATLMRLDGMPELAALIEMGNDRSKDVAGEPR